MSFSPFTVVSGPAIPLLRANVDIDIIIRVDRMLAIPKEQLGPYAMEALREDPASVLNQPAFHGAPTLLAGENFGSGSSREPAVWALVAMGLRCVIAPSFGDIFYSNCFQNGLLPIRLPMAQINALAALCAHGEALTVDLRDNTLHAPDGSTLGFKVDPLRREGLLHGLDDIGLTLKEDTLVREWQQRDRAARPWAWPRAMAAA